MNQQEWMLETSISKEAHPFQRLISKCKASDSTPLFIKADEASWALCGIGKHPKLACQKQKTCDVTTAQENVLLNRGPPIAARPYSRTLICPIIQKWANAFQCVSLLYRQFNEVPEKSWPFIMQEQGIRILCALSRVDLSCNEELCPCEMHQRQTAIFQTKKSQK